METAVVGVLGALIGILLSNGIALLLDVRRRRERVKDVQTSLRAEIRSNWLRLHATDLTQYAESAIARMRSESGFTPFIPRESRTIIFAAAAGDVQILPTDVIDPVVFYYDQLSRLTQFVEDMRSEQYKSLETDRKIEMYRDYIAMLNNTEALAGKAIEALNSSLEAGSQ